MIKIGKTNIKISIKSEDEFGASPTIEGWFCDIKSEDTSGGSPGKELDF